MKTAIEKNKFFSAQEIRRLSLVFSSIGKNIELVIGVSGGIDSMFLASGLTEAWRAGQLPSLKSIELLHFDHSLRGKESDGDARFVAKFARKNNLTLRVVKFIWDKNESRSQAECRKKRELELASPYYGNKWLVLGHHLNDQAETFIFRVMRGTGRNGLKCMLPIDSAKKRVRPFLILKKSRPEIEAHARRCGLRFRDDSSNANKKYSRNRIRQKIIPLLIEENPAALKNIFHLCEQFQIDKVEKCTPIYEDEFLSLYIPDVSLRNADQLALSFGLNREQTRQLLQILDKDSGKVRVNADKVLHWGQGVLIFEKRAVKIKNKYAVSHSTALGKFTLKDIKNNALMEFGSEERQLGDSAKKCFQKMRIPASLRSEVPCIESGGKFFPVLPPSLSHKVNFSVANLNFEFKPSKLAIALSDAGCHL